MSAGAQFQLLVGTSPLADATPLAELAGRLVLLSPLAAGGAAAPPPVAAMVAPPAVEQQLEPATFVDEAGNV